MNGLKPAVPTDAVRVDDLAAKRLNVTAQSARALRPLVQAILRTVDRVNAERTQTTNGEAA